jgi:predicted nucleic acid-binding protein
MKNIIALIDTNVLIDALALRVPFEENAKKILKKCYSKDIAGFVTTHSIANIFYILRKIYSVEERKSLLLNLCKLLKVVEINQNSVFNSLTDKSFNDIEDFLQSECAKIIKADYIITRNISDFSNSIIPAILPEDFLKKLENK